MEIAKTATPYAHPDPARLADLDPAQLAHWDPARLAAVISPLRRTLLAAARAAEKLPEIPDAQIEILRALAPGTAVAPGELAEQLGLSRSTISNLLAGMEASGLVERRPHPGDGRRVEVVRTDRARDLFDRFDLAAGTLVTDAAAALTPGDRAALAAALPALERLREALQRLRTPEEPA
ncbi:MarR family transcriptional regulator [Nocardia sp. NPDC024068]|uniref:MarR family winged helix-turn-helix transcriptional regulator n=1 Tax=Nocardia sp. NPDC024068 TaxID=3157197 RepID=UPI0033FC1F76